MIEAGLIICLSIGPFLFGWWVSKFTLTLAPKWANVAALFALGLLFGALLGTTYTHAFDILWWWKGCAFGVLLAAGGMAAKRA